MKWPFDHRKAKRDEHVTALDAKARTGEVKLVEKVLELDRRRNYLDKLTADALKDLGRPHSA